MEVAVPFFEGFDFVLHLVAMARIGRAVEAVGAVVAVAVFAGYLAGLAEAGKVGGGAVLPSAVFEFLRYHVGPVEFGRVAEVVATVDLPVG